MSIEIVENAAVGVAVTERMENLRAIQKAGCAAAIWRRATPPGFDSWVQAFSPDDLPTVRCLQTPSEVHATLERVLDRSGMPKASHRDWLIADISNLAFQIADIMAAPFVRLRIDVIRTNACRKFHMDANQLRLICTYRGTGTQYGISNDGGEPKRVFTVPTGSPMVMRGCQWPGSPKSGVVHRSPPIEGTGETRLVLVLDPEFDWEDT